MGWMGDRSVSYRSVKDYIGEVELEDDHRSSQKSRRNIPTPFSN